MNKTTVIQCICAIVLAIYIVGAVMYTRASAATDTCNGLVINVVDSASRSFVTADLIDLRLGGLSERIQTVRRDSINTLEIERDIMSMDNIEMAKCMWLNNGTLRLDVTPLQPLARVFDTKGDTYYINRAGKRMEASPRFRIDVPVITGNFNPNRQPSIAFPVIDYLADHAEVTEMISSIEIANNRDIIVIPRIRGHVVNLGNASDLDNKFERLRVFYSDVMPVKGWEYYDTLTVKWRRQIVAHQRNARVRAPEVLVEEHEDIDDEATMGAAPTLDQGDRKPAKPEKKTETKQEKKSESADTKKSADNKKATDKKSDNKKASDKKSDNKKTDNTNT